MGHALNNALQDVLCRYWRVSGRDVLLAAGRHHAGIAAQMVVDACSGSGRSRTGAR